MFAPKAASKRARKVVAPAAPDATGCPLHAPECVCCACPGVTATDGYGFPHPGDYRGLKPVRVCAHCSYPVPREHWDDKTNACTYEGCCERR